MAGTLSMINTILANYHHMSDWQHAVLSFLGSIELFFCIIQMTLVLYRLYTSSPVPQGRRNHSMLFPLALLRPSGHFPGLSSGDISTPHLWLAVAKID